MVTINLHQMFTSQTFTINTVIKEVTEMNYVKVYIDFIKSRLDRKIIHDEYYERHHIIPRSIFDDLEVQNQLNVFGIKGKWSKKNIIELTGREHFFAHELLQAMNISQNQKIKMT